MDDRRCLQLSLVSHRWRIDNTHGLAWERSLGLGLIVVLCACTDRGLTRPPESPASRTAMEFALSESARQNLGQNGQFIQLQSARDGDMPGGEAVRYANAYGQDFAPLIMSFLEETRGSSINRKRLRACGRPLLAETAFEPLSSEFLVGVRRQFGSFWLVTLCADGEPQVSVAVSAIGGGLSFVKGRLVTNGEIGNHFFAIGIPKGHSDEFPISPEQAAQFAYQTTGRHVTSTPRLVMPLHTEGIPQSAKWIVALDGPAKFRLESRDVERGETAIGLDIDGRGSATIRNFASSDDQPTAVPFQYELPVQADGFTRGAFSMKRVAGSIVGRSGEPLRFEPAESRTKQ